MKFNQIRTSANRQLNKHCRLEMELTPHLLEPTHAMFFKKSSSFFTHLRESSTSSNLLTKTDLTLTALKKKAQPS